MKTLLRGIDELEGRRVVIRLQGGGRTQGNRKTNHILLYFLHQE